MDSANVAAAIVRVQLIHAEVERLRRTIDAEELTVSDRQYLSRCFDLLEMELGAVRQYLGGVV